MRILWVPRMVSKVPPDIAFATSAGLTLPAFLTAWKITCMPM